MMKPVSTTESAKKINASAERVRQPCKSGQVSLAKLERQGFTSLQGHSPSAKVDASTQPLRRVRLISANPKASYMRLMAGREQAKTVISEMSKKGIEVELFGSMRSGKAHPYSDIDLLVTDCGDKDPEIVIYEIGLLEQNIPIDVTILSLVPAHSIRYVMESARG